MKELQQYIFEKLILAKQIEEKLILNKNTKIVTGFEFAGEGNFIKFNFNELSNSDKINNKDRLKDINKYIPNNVTVYKVENKYVNPTFINLLNKLDKYKIGSLRPIESFHIKDNIFKIYEMGKTDKNPNPIYILIHLYNVGKPYYNNDIYVYDMNV